MEIRVLRYFLTVVREESITKAAEVLHITQPTLSRQLAQMEEAVGVKLFVRGTRKISLTNSGLLLRRRAEEILELVDKTEKELGAQEKNVEGVVSVGCGDIGAVQLIPGLIREFNHKYPHVSFDLYTAAADHVRERMDRGLTDIGILLEPVTVDKYDFVRLPVREEWVVAMHPDAPLAARNEGMLRMLFGKVEEPVMHACVTYLRISAYSYPALAVYNSGAAVYRSIGKTSVTMYISVVSNAINVAGNIIGVMVLHAGVAGVAWPSLIARTFSAAAITWFCFRTENKVFYRWKYIFQWNGGLLKRILKVAVPNGVENGIFQLVKVALSSIAALFGTWQIAANGVAQSIWSLAALAGQAEWLSGRRIGNLRQASQKV